MRPTQRKLKDATGRLLGITAHDGFLGHEALLQFVMSDENKKKLDDLGNEKLRSFRDTYRDFAERSEKLARRGDSTRLKQLYESWIQSCVTYFGYASFRPGQIPHREEGQIPSLLPPLTSGGESHSALVFFACATNSPLRAFDSGTLTDAKGQTHHKSTRLESITEQVEKALQDSGLPEAILFMPHAAYYFRSESRTAGQCLEARWDEIMPTDNDDALALATFILRSQFFAYDAQIAESNQDSATELDSSSDENEGDEDTEDSGGSTSSVRLTPSSKLFKEDLEQARRITEELHTQVVLALEILVNERLAVDKALSTKACTAKHNQSTADELFKDGLFVLYRLLFVLYAEARNFLPVQEHQFASFYSIEHLRNWAEEFTRRNRRGLANPDGTYIWGAMKAIFTLLRRGTTLNGGVLVSPYNGQLFADDRAPLFDSGPELRDEAMSRVLTALTRVGGEASGRRLHFANLGVEQLGAVYEALLAQKPVIIREPSIWVPAHGGGVGLVTENLADALDMRRFDDAAGGGRESRRAAKGKGRAKAGLLSNHVDPRRPGYNPTIGRFIVAPLGGAKRQTASFYTPPKLAEFLVKRTLRPLVEGKTENEIKGLKIIEPAMGSGGFVIATVRYLAEQLLIAKRCERTTIAARDMAKDDFYSLQRCKREIIESSIFGVDINPLAIELARTSLYLEALVPGEPLPFLHHRLKSGNSLIGADFQGKAMTDWGDGQEFPIIFDLPIAEIKVKKEVWDAWDEVHSARISADELKDVLAEIQRSRKTERKSIAAATWSTWAVASQTKVGVFLRESRAALAEFEKLQASGDIVDQLDARHKDYLSYIPDMDPVLIEAYEVEIDPSLMLKRRKALITELGEKNYNRLVARQRAYHRLKALGDLSVALWYWPLDNFKAYPTYKTFKEMVDWLLNDASLERKAKVAPLSRDALRSMRVALKVARDVGAFHWDIEFAQVYADLSHPAGFDACISNPPWKVVGLRKKDILPIFDPQHLDTKPSQKQSRVEALYKTEPKAAKAWLEQSYMTSQITEHWRHGQLSEIPPEGQVDLCVLFALRTERVTRKLGRSGLLVSRSSIFVNNATKNLRERLFREWGLQEACSFVNRLTLFEIPSYLEFTLLVGQHGKYTSSPRFIHALTDPNTLDVVARNLDVRDVSRIVTGPKPAELTEDVIRKYFSKQNLSIPGLTDPRQLEIAKALHMASGPVVYLDETDVSIASGIHRTSGPKTGLSQYTEKIPPKELPKWDEVLAGNVGKWVPLYRGRDINLFDPTYGWEDGKLNSDQYGEGQSITTFGFDISRISLAWRGIGRTSDQRTFIPSILPPGFWATGNVCVAQTRDDSMTIALAVIYGSIVMDFLVRLVGSSWITTSIVNGLPIANYTSWALDVATTILKSTIAKTNPRYKPVNRFDRARIDALIWIHYDLKSEVLDRAKLNWMLSTQFDCLTRNDPEYINLVLSAFDHYTKDPRHPGTPGPQIFSKKTIPIPPNPKPQKPKATRKRKTN